MASLAHTPTEAQLINFNVPNGAASGPSFATKRAVKGTLSASAVVVSLLGCKGIPLITVAAGVSVYISTDPSLGPTDAAINWTLVADGSGFAACPAYIAFDGTGAWELMVGD
jgi:hypothetical protein